MIIAFWGLDWGPTILGNYRKGIDFTYTAWHTGAYVRILRPPTRQSPQPELEMTDPYQMINNASVRQILTVALP